VFVSVIIRTALRLIENQLSKIIIYLSGCSIALGLQSKKIQNWQLSSHSYDKGYEPSKARLNSDGAWCSDVEQKWVEYLQIRLDKVRHISGIASQGYKMFFGSYFVKQYSLKYSYDGSVWFWYKEGILIKVFVDLINSFYFICIRERGTVRIIRGIMLI